MDLVFSYADIDYFIAARRYYGSVAERNRLLEAERFRCRAQCLRKYHVQGGFRPDRSQVS